MTATVIPQQRSRANGYVLVFAGPKATRLDIPRDIDPHLFLEQIPALFRAEYGPSPRDPNPWRKAVLVLHGHQADLMYFIAD